MEMEISSVPVNRKCFAICRVIYCIWAKVNDARDGDSGILVLETSLDLHALKIALRTSGDAGLSAPPECVVTCGHLRCT